MKLKMKMLKLKFQLKIDKKINMLYVINIA